MRSLSVPLPPLNEQRRIVERIEALQSRSRKAREALEAIPTLLEQFRQSVLAGAFRGDLTADWRRRHPDTEPASALLERIREKRRCQWQEKFPRKKYKEPDPIDESELTELPEGWCWASLDELCTVITSGSRGWAKYYSNSGSLFIRSQDINTDSLQLEDVAKVVVPKTEEGQRTRVSRYDVLITITGANVGRCATVDRHLEDAFISQHVALVRPVIPTLARLVHQWVISPTGGRGRLLTDAYGNGKPGLNLDNVRELAVPLPPALEQEPLLNALQVHNRHTRQAREEVTGAIPILRELDQSILAKAFRGELVEQDPADEAASALLDRIKAERQKAPARKPRRRPSRPAGGSPFPE